MDQTPIETLPYLTTYFRRQPNSAGLTRYGQKFETLEEATNFLWEAKKQPEVKSGHVSQTIKGKPVYLESFSKIAYLRKP